MVTSMQKQTGNKPSKPKAKGNMLNDISTCFPDIEMRTVFDIGANVGQTVTKIRTVFPKSKIYAFEPIHASYERLLETHKDDQMLSAHNIALGRKEENVSMTSMGTSTMNSIVRGAPTTGATTNVKAINGDAFCEKNDIESIDFLKIDTEGHDMEVLIGFSNMLRDGKVSLI